MQYGHTLMYASSMYCVRDVSILFVGGVSPLDEEVVVAVALLTTAVTAAGEEGVALKLW